MRRLLSSLGLNLSTAPKPTPLPSKPVELNIDENQIILEMTNFVNGYYAGDPAWREPGLAQYEAAVARLGKDGVLAFIKKLNDHADSLGGFNKAGV